MRSLIISPLTGTGQTIDDAIRPLVWDVLGQPLADHVASPAMLDGKIPATNLMMASLEITGAQLSQIKSDERFFVLEPGPGYNGAALANWLDGKGAQGHGVTEDDAAEVAIEKLRGYFKSL